MNDAGRDADTVMADAPPGEIPEPPQAPEPPPASEPPQASELPEDSSSLVLPLVHSTPDGRGFITPEPYTTWEPRTRWNAFAISDCLLVWVQAPDSTEESPLNQQHPAVLSSILVNPVDGDVVFVVNWMWQKKDIKPIAVAWRSRVRREIQQWDARSCKCALTDSYQLFTQAHIEQQDRPSFISRWFGIKWHDWSRDVGSLRFISFKQQSVDFLRLNDLHPLRGPDVLASAREQNIFRDRFPKEVLDMIYEWIPIPEFTRLMSPNDPVRLHPQQRTLMAVAKAPRARLLRTVIPLIFADCRYRFDLQGLGIGTSLDHFESLCIQLEALQMPAEPSCHCAYVSVNAQMASFNAILPAFAVALERVAQKGQLRKVGIRLAMGVCKCVLKPTMSQSFRAFAIQQLLPGFKKLRSPGLEKVDITFTDDCPVAECALFGQYTHGECRLHFCQAFIQPIWNALSAGQSDEMIEKNIPGDAYPFKQPEHWWDD